MISTLYCLIYDFLCICDDFLLFSVFFGLTKCDSPFRCALFRIINQTLVLFKHSVNNAVVKLDLKGFRAVAISYDLKYDSLVILHTREQLHRLKKIV